MATELHISDKPGQAEVRKAIVRDAVAAELAYLALEQQNAQVPDTVHALGEMVIISAHAVAKQ